MTGNHRKSIIAIVVLTLFVLIVWRWWPSPPQFDSVGRTDGTFSIEDFDVKAIPIDSISPLSRDIFHPKKVEITKLKIAAPSAASQLAPIATQTPEEIARDSAQAEFAQIRCVGISIRNNRMQAYLIIAGEPLLISNGDKVGSRFVVEKILTDGVSLRDPATGIGGLITISGK